MTKLNGKMNILYHVHLYNNALWMQFFMMIIRCPGETGEDFQEEDFQEEVDNEDKVDNEDNEEDEINEYPSDLDNEYPDSDYYDERSDPHWSDDDSDRDLDDDDDFYDEYEENYYEEVQVTKKQNLKQIWKLKLLI